MRKEISFCMFSVKICSEMNDLTGIGRLNGSRKPPSIFTFNFENIQQWGIFNLPLDSNFSLTQWFEREFITRRDYIRNRDFPPFIFDEFSNQDKSCKEIEFQHIQLIIFYYISGIYLFQYHRIPVTFLDFMEII